MICKNDINVIQFYFKGWILNCEKGFFEISMFVAPQEKCYEVKRKHETETREEENEMMMDSCSKGSV